MYMKAFSSVISLFFGIPLFFVWLKRSGIAVLFLVYTSKFKIQKNVIAFKGSAQSEEELG